MGKVLGSLFGLKPKKPKTNSKFTDETTKLVGKPLPVIYGTKVRTFGNVVYRRLSSDQKFLTQAVAMAWGPVSFDTTSLRINEKRPEFINGELNPDRSVDPGFIKDVKVWTHTGRLGQTPSHGLTYGLNRTAYIWVEAKASDQLSSISSVECDLSRGLLFSTAEPETDYNTPIPDPIAAAFPSGIRSGNPIAASLDYLLNSDYGAGRDITAFESDFASWIAGINYCEFALRVERTDTISWGEGAFIKTEDFGRTITKSADLTRASEVPIPRDKGTGLD